MPINERKLYIKAKRATFFNDFFESVGYYVAMKEKMPKEITAKRGIKYSDSPRSVMDIYFPKSGEKTKSPLFIYIHGGGFVSGKMKNRTAYCYNFAARGYVCANIDYDRAPSKMFPSQVFQLATALDYLYREREKLGFDENRVVIGGESAGAYFATYLAQLLTSERLKTLLNIEFASFRKLIVKSTVLISGAMEIFGMCDNKFYNLGFYIECFTGKTIAELKACKDDDYKNVLSPLLNVDGTFPPSVIVKATRDALRTESDWLAEKLEKFGVDHVLIIADGIISPHAFSIATRLKKSKVCLGKTLEFVGKYVKNE